MNMHDPSDPMFPFFMDEFLFHSLDEYNELEPQYVQKDDGFSTYFRICPDCRRVLTVYSTNDIIRCACGSSFRNE